ncbi:hypothetical protein PPMP20_01805 [Paraburkholderia phymatum]|uniref:Uncharacterized protein n=1 Tax=Paraburkholderia phymatum (strain DSM 17167 / CIP 108236 / LMG 21445 / STM815) TaxID=391038 RepID=B2JW60_PARP8|nr:hypothetical protein [Paraburkholderia phymatum]ACC75187.1 hypothetical protein Bphy_6132 [Paraburkholderia phymatum STM815]
MYKQICATMLLSCLICPPSFASTTATEKPATAGAKLAVNMGEGCAISVADLFAGHLASGMAMNASYWTDRPPVKTTIGDFAVNFVCSHATETSKEQVANQHGATYDNSANRWTLYFESARDRHMLSPVTHIHIIKALNSSGFYTTQDDVDGDPKQRVRFFSYCLFHDSLAICGSGQVMRLSEPKGNLLPYVLDILRTVEFVDPATVKPASLDDAASATTQ